MWGRGDVWLLFVGAEDMFGDEALIGSMDEVAICSSALTATQRTTHFNAAGR